MNNQIINPLKAISKSYLRMPVVKTDINDFVAHLSVFIDTINEKESEEYAKNQLTKFLNDSFYSSKNKINTKGRIDLAIYDEENPIVIFECKKPKSSDADMMSKANINVKAFHELILYYLRERIEHNNTNIKHLIATNMYEWFVFDERDFDHAFYRNPKLIKDYETFKNENKDTEHFYKSIAKTFVDKENGQINYVHFDLRDYKKGISTSLNEDSEDQKSQRNKLRALYKFLSPNHLLKQPFENDSNSLNSEFYHELLHIIGLEESKDGTKKIIQRKKEGDRNEGSLLENVIFNIEETDRLRRLNNPNSFGETSEERMFSVALELCITWIDRVLFLKLLESQLVRYHRGDKDYRFLNSKVIPDYDVLKNVFFSVLAKEESERKGKWKEFFQKTPYLNSSLFEPSSLEEDIIGIESLDSHLEIDIYRGTKLLDNSKQAKGKLHTLEYLFKFLDAYNFASEGADEEQEDRKTLINAAVLGLIFEKINGYKDGSFFTPGFITMYMCRETIRRSVLQKFNETYSWNCDSFESIYNYLKRNPTDILEYNKVIDDLKICDPSVGSGHFLVSALNELIAIKSELGILADKTGKVLPISIVIENDDLIAVLDDQIFEYKAPNAKFGANDNQRIQETLFHEKEKIIEHCLFGVDINGNSVKICRLRLWIELLKNAYYTSKSDYTKLETLPNIDINIKRGNSLVSRFDLDADLTTVFKQQKFNYDTYRLAVESYKTAPTKAAKNGLLEFINEIKSQFKTVFYNNDPLNKKLSTLRGQRELLNQDMDLFGKIIRNEKEVETEKKRLDISIAQTEQKIQDIKTNVFYKNAFEWRFEFPEVMDKNGNFVGFDILIGNPPYISLQRMQESAFLKTLNYKTFESSGDLYSLFYERGNSILRQNGHLCYITSNKWINANYGKSTRGYFAKETNPLILIDFAKIKIFDSATVFVNIILTQKNINNQNLEACSYEESTLTSFNVNDYFQKNKFKLKNLNEDVWKVNNDVSQNITSIIVSKGKQLKHWTDINFNRGITTGFNDAFHITETEKNDLINSDKINSEIIKPLLRGKDIKRWRYGYENKYIIFTRQKIDISKYPFIEKHLSKFKIDLNPKKSISDAFGRKPGTYKWYEIQDNTAYYEEFEKPKIVWIEISDKANYAYDESGMYLTNSAYFISGKNLKYILAILNSKVADFYFFQITATIAGGRKRYTKQYVAEIPVPYIDKKNQEPFIKIVDYVLFLRTQADNKDARIAASYFESLLNVMVYELYFEDLVKKAGFDVLKYVNKFSTIDNFTSENEKLKYLYDLFESIHVKEHPIRNSIFYIDSIPEIKEITNATK